MTTCAAPNNNGLNPFTMAAREWAHNQCCTLPTYQSDYESAGKRVTVKVEGKRLTWKEVYYAHVTGP